MKMSGMKTNGMLFIPGLGMVAISNDPIIPGKKEFYVASGGPLVGLMAIFGLLTTYIYITPNPMILAIVFLSVIVHLFNMLPIAPLDGGRMIRSSCYLIGGWVGKITSIIGFLFCTAIFYKMEWYFVGSLIVFVGFTELRQKKKDLPRPQVLLGFACLIVYWILCIIFIWCFVSVLGDDVTAAIKMMT